MDKKAFLKELEKSLSVLQENEISDIISEYEQHIDMKIQSGQTEEQAIADFGSLSELTADILEAYHVRADYAAEKKEKLFSFAEGEKAGQELLQQTGQMCRRTGGGILRLGHRAAFWIRGLAGWTGKFVGVCRQQIWRPVLWIRERMSRRMEQQQEADNAAGVPLPKDHRERRRLAERTGTLMKGIQDGTAAAASGGMGLITRAFRFFCRVLFWGIRVCWNFCWGAFAACCAAGGLICLFGLGMLAVLWMQHYPLAGVTIGCLGMVLCCFSAAGFAVTLLRRPDRSKSEKRKPAEVSAVPDAGEGGGAHA